MKKRYLVYLVLTIALSINLSCISHFESSYSYPDSIARLTNVDDNKYGNINKMLAYNADYIDNNNSCEFKENHNIKSIKVDMIKPTIEYKKTVKTTVGKKIDLLKYVKVTDNSGETIIPTIEGKYNFNKAGTYKLKYKATDSNNNTSEVSFKLIANDNVVVTQPVVVEQPVVQQVTYTPTNSNTRQNIVEIARSQLGNVGGQPYWSWYGFNGRVEWCATFVSWVANQAGVLYSHVPKFAGVGTGVRYFKSKGQWQGRNYVPSPGDIIFFDYNYDGRNDHVGIVEKVADGKVYTIEGNSTNACKNRTYAVGSRSISGYGVPNY